jgi:hypothetical protein
VERARSLGLADGEQHGGLEPAERQIVVVGVVRLLRRRSMGRAKR